MNTTHSDMKDLEMRGLLQYLVMDVMTLAPEQLPPENSVVCYYTHSEQLVDPKLVITYAYQICKAKGHAFCEHVFGAWTSTLRSLPSSAWSPSLLTGCLALLGADAWELMQAADPDIFATDDALFQHFFANGRDLLHFHDRRWPLDHLEFLFQTTFASMTIEFVRQKFAAKTVEEAFFESGNEENQRVFFWKLVGANRWFNRQARLSGAYCFGLGAELMLALIDKGLPGWCWAGLAGPYNDTLLQHIIEPISATLLDWNDEEEAKGRLCIFLAERLSLEELCHENERGENVLYHANNLRDVFQRPAYRGADGTYIWIQVHRVIVERMAACVSEFQGNLAKLIDLAQSVHYGLQGNLS